MTTRRRVLKIGATAAASTALASGFVSAGDDGNGDDGGTGTGDGGGQELVPSELFSAGVLTGEQEVPPVDTDGEGAAVFGLTEDETELPYGLWVINVEEVTQAHIHVGAEGENGDVVAWLFGLENDSGNITSPLEQGVTENGELVVPGLITEAELVGPLEGQSLSDLAALLREGNAYVNVHTEQNPAGEIRGQIHSVNEVEIELEEELELWVGVGEPPEYEVETTLEVREE